MAIVEQNLESWLAERSTFLGASESPAVLGVGYASESAFSVWARKTGLDTEQLDREELDWGHAIQPVALSMFEKRTGIHVINPGEFTVTRHPSIPWIGATLDGLAETPEGLAVVEAKNVCQFNADEWQDDEPPIRVAVQIQHQIFAASATLGYAVACIGGNKLRWIRMERDDRFIDAMLPKLEAFWECVRTKTPPPIDGSYATARTLAKLHPNDNGDEIALPAEAEQWAKDLADAKAKIKAAEEIEQLNKNRLIAAIGDATFGALPNGGRFSHKSQTRKEYVCKESTFRVLRSCK